MMLKRVCHRCVLIGFAREAMSRKSLVVFQHQLMMAGFLRNTLRNETTVRRLSVNGCQVKRNPLRAKSGAVTQLAYARRGIVTPEMEYIAIRENLGRDEMRNAERESRNADNSSPVTRVRLGLTRRANDLAQQHRGEALVRTFPMR